MNHPDIAQQIAMRSLQTCMDRKLNVIDITDTIEAACMEALKMLERATYKTTIDTRVE